MYDIIITGAGMAGLTAAIYGARAGLKVLLIEKAFPGGQIVYARNVENYPGYKAITGAKLISGVKEQARECGAEFITAEVTDMDLTSEIKTLTTEKGEYSAKTVILATGASYKKLGCPGEDRFVSRGVSYCAVCDGALFANKDVCVVGSEDAAFEDALYLAEFCKTVYIINPAEGFSANQRLSDSVKAKDNIRLMPKTEIKEIHGEKSVDKILLSGESQALDISAVFVAIGMQPQTGGLKGIIDLDDSGYIKTAEDCATNIPAVFAAGDVRSKRLRQLVTAAADGAIAASGCVDYLK